MKYERCEPTGTVVRHKEDRPDSSLFTPVVVVPTDQWKRLVGNWRVISAVTDGEDEGTLESSAVIDTIIAEVEVQNG